MSSKCSSRYEAEHKNSVSDKLVLTSHKLYPINQEKKKSLLSLTVTKTNLACFLIRSSLGSVVFEHNGFSSLGLFNRFPGAGCLPLHPSSNPP